MGEKKERYLVVAGWLEATLLRWTGVGGQRGTRQKILRRGRHVGRVAVCEVRGG